MLLGFSELIPIKRRVKFTTEFVLFECIMIPFDGDSYNSYNEKYMLFIIIYNWKLSMPAEKKDFIRSVIDKYNEEIPVLIKKSCIKCGECADKVVCRERAVIFYPQKYENASY